MNSLIAIGLSVLGFLLLWKVFKLALRVAIIIAVGIFVFYLVTTYLI